MPQLESMASQNSDNATFLIRRKPVPGGNSGPASVGTRPSTPPLSPPEDQSSQLQQVSAIPEAEALPSRRSTILSHQATEFVPLLATSAPDVPPISQRPLSSHKQGAGDILESQDQATLPSSHPEFDFDGTDVVEIVAPDPECFPIPTNERVSKGSRVQDPGWLRSSVLITFACKFFASAAATLVLHEMSKRKMGSQVGVCPTITFGSIAQLRSWFLLPHCGTKLTGIANYWLRGQKWHWNRDLRRGLLTWTICQLCHLLLSGSQFAILIGLSPQAPSPPQC